MHIKFEAQEPGNEDESNTKKISQADPERLERTVFVGNIPVALTQKVRICYCLFLKAYASEA